jgi:hypothetical protein
MVQGYKFVFYYLWIAPHALLIPIVVIMYARRLYQNFPIFFAYILYEIFQFLLLFTCYQVTHALGSLYRYVFIATIALSTALRFGIIQEIFNNAFRDYPRLEKVAVLSMRSITALLVIAAIVSAIYTAGTVPDNLMAGVRLLERSVTIIQVGLLLFLFVFSRMFGLSWRSYIFGIAFGFALYASAQLAEWTISLMSLSEHSKDLLDFLATGSYHVCVLIWLGYFITAESRVHSPAYAIPEIERWNGELERSR